jgi:heptaprenyl diphosphate synthase
LAGDFLFARASELVADLGPEAVRLQAQTFERLVTGQLLETAGPKADEDPVEFHLKVLAEKTGSLIATSAQFGAEFSGASKSDVLAMRKFGELIGVTFQLADDIIDMSSTEVELGKQRGNDLLEGVPTLTTLLVRRNNRPEDQELMKFLIGPVSSVDLIKVLDLISLNPAINQAKEIAQDWANKARTSIQGITNKETLKVLEQLFYVLPSLVSFPSICCENY